MERGSMDNLKFDRRLSRRRGWHADGELKAHEDSLPDVSDKRFVPEEESGSTSAPEDTLTSEI